ncbi:DUF885 domain-containing protein [Halpernia frigidisoli]|uniref:Uncharacterized conserved protein, DUF885 familyt n=1 Tax=Halpernia frigidisoli TaxID=1125876 RepID=A0A1I3FKL0_9FLAO|nr:DUF885 domain-containing protein [Halpernia frigidisoli]SFI11710.1 Uncharacterized conserved protein, DUF885 familyt [Halpernia frigidisoli]
MKKFIIILCISSIFGISKSQNSSSNKISTDKNQTFTEFENKFMNDYWAQFPESSVYSGLHKYDAVLTIPNLENRNSDLNFAKKYLLKLNEFSLNELSDLNKIDFHLIEDQLNEIVWSTNELRSWQWNPGSYNVGGIFAQTLFGKYAPLEVRLKSFQKKAELVPQYFKSAKENIKNPVEILQNLGIAQNEGSLEIFEKNIQDSVKVSKLSEADKNLVLKSSKAAATSIKNYIAWLKNLKPTERRDFRLGKELYDQKFRYNIQSSFSAEELYQLALKRKTFIHTEMAKLAKEMSPKYYGNQKTPTSDFQLIRKVLDTLSSQHVKPEEFQSAIEKQIPDLVKFINDKNLLYLDPSKPLIVRKEPAYMAGVAGASVSAPGPYDKDGDTYYNVGSLSGWSKEKSESYLREYNNYMLQILDIHEAIPGHYTQLVYANQSPSIIKSVFGNGSMIEGWAVYGEQMMLENGYGNSSPELMLMWYKWNLRSVCNTILDYSVHTKNMSKDEAMKLLTDEAFQEKTEAEGKWNRVSVGSVQLTSYYNGYQEIINLRNEIKDKEKSAFNVKAFNEKFLSYGNSPVKYIREMMLK